MNDLEGPIRSALEAEAATVRPRPDALEENRRRLRRGVRRRRAAIPTVAALSAATVTAGVFVVVEHGSSAGPSGLAEPRTVKDIRQLASLTSIVTIGGRVPGGADFQVEALGTDGSVLGRSPDKKVWEADGTRPTPKSLGVRAEAGLTTGPGFRTWMTLGSDGIRCRSIPDGRDRVISPQGLWPKAGIWASGEMLAWHDAMIQPYTTRACEPGRYLRNRSIVGGHAGEIVALSGTFLFSTDPLRNKDLREIDARTGRILALHPLPAGVPKFNLQSQPLPSQPGYIEVTPKRYQPGTGPTKLPRRLYPSYPPGEAGRLPDNWDAVHTWYAAATQDVFAWVAGGRLRVTDRRTWRHTTKLPGRQPVPAPGTRAVMTAGDLLVAYTARTVTQGWRSVLYNTRTGSTITIPGQAYAAGDHLLWRQGTDYRLAQVG